MIKSIRVCDFCESQGDLTTTTLKYMSIPVGNDDPFPEKKTVDMCQPCMKNAFNYIWSLLPNAQKHSVLKSPLWSKDEPK